MDKPHAPEASTAAKIRPIRQLSIVWIVPIVAVLAGLWMVYDTMSKRGPEITLTMANAEGIEAEKTIIKVLDVNIGKISSVNLSPDNKSVVMKARLNAGTESLLRQDTELWVIKPRFDKGKVSGLSTLFSGAYIQLEPGKSTKSQNKFRVQANPPITAVNVPGLRIKLVSHGVKALSVGDPILFEGFPVGRIETLEFDVNAHSIAYNLFIEAAYAPLVTENSRFWNSSGVQIKTGIDGVKLSTGTLEALISGGVSFDVPPQLSAGEPAKNNASFSLYPDEDSINEHIDTRYIDYVALFDNSVRGLVVGAPVEYRGLRVGTVEAVPYVLNDSIQRAFEKKAIPVLLRLELGRMEIYIGKHPEREWKTEIDQAIKQGLSARLKNGNLVTGAVFVDMDFDLKYKTPALEQIHGLPIIPTRSGGLAQIENKVDALLDKLNNLPLETSLESANKMMGNVDKLMIELKQLSVEIRTLTSNPDVKRLPRELQQTLESLRQTLDGFSPQSGSYQQLQRLIENASQLLRETRPLIRTLNEKPSALLFDRNVKDVQPQGAKP